MRRATKRALRDLHGPDAEILEFEAEAPTGRSYRLRQADGWGWAPHWLRFLIGIGGMAVLLPLMIAQIAILILAAWALYAIGWSILKDLLGLG